jgi:putative hemolysin
LDEPPSFNLITILSDESLLYYIFTAGLLFLTSWASTVEAALFSFPNEDVEQFKQSQNEREKLIASLLASPRLLLNALTTLKYLALLCAATFAIIALTHSVSSNQLSENSVVGIVITLTILFSIIGVIVPKIYGSTYFKAVAKNNIKACGRIVMALKPLVAPLLRTSERVEKKLDSQTEQKSVETLTQALQLATVDNDRIDGEEEILKGVVNFGTLTVDQVMRQRHEITFTDVSLNFDQLLDFVKGSGYSRVPVCDRSLDKVAGFLYIKDLLPFLNEKSSFVWQRLIRPAYVVQDTKKIDFLLKEFQEKRVHMALVVNESKDTVGVITLEDIIEEILGDINDEFDEVGLRFQQLDERTYLFDGKTSIHEFCKVVGIDPALFQPIKGINESLSGVLLEVNEKLPAIGDEISVEPFTFVVESVDRKRIKKIRVHVHQVS